MFTLNQNKFMVQGGGGIFYTYNKGEIAAAPKLATMNFLNTLELILRLIEQYKTANEKLERDISVLQ